VAQLVDQRFGGGSGEHDVVVFTSDVLTANRPAYRAAVARVLGQVRTSPGVGRVIGPFAPGAGGLVSSDGHAAVAIVGLAGDASQRAARAAAVQHTVTTALSDSPVGARLTGYSPVSNALGTVEATDAEQAEAIGLPVAFGVLILALGALVAAVVPLVTALLGLLATFGVLGGLIFLVPFDPLLTTVATMIALGIGIDYSLFILSRFREELARRGVTDRRDRENIAAAVGATLASSGRTIAFSGLIVAVSLCSLFVIGAPVFREIAIGIIVWSPRCWPPRFRYCPPCWPPSARRSTGAGCPPGCNPPMSAPARPAGGPGGHAR
jgi:RND superfamily putative drug exporter